MALRAELVNTSQTKPNRVRQLHQNPIALSIAKCARRVIDGIFGRGQISVLLGTRGAEDGLHEVGMLEGQVGHDVAGHPVGQ